MGESQHVALYTRVSTPGQADQGYSLETQRDRLEAYVKSKPDWIVSDVYEDAGQSGRTTDRPAYQRLWDTLQDWDVLLVVRIDRAHRRMQNFLAMMTRLQDMGRAFASAEESLDTTTPMGRFVVDIMARVAQLESEQIAKRSAEGKQQSARDGWWVHGTPPVGYDRREVDGHYTLEPNGDADHVRAVFARYARGESQSAIAEDVPWSVMTVGRILDSPVYRGRVYCGEVEAEGRHPALVSEGVWEAAQAIRRSR